RIGWISCIARQFGELSRQNNGFVYCRHAFAILSKISAELAQCKLRNTPHCICLSESIQILRKSTRNVWTAQFLVEYGNEVVENGCRLEATCPGPVRTSRSVAVEYNFRHEEHRWLGRSHAQARDELIDAQISTAIC